MSENSDVWVGGTASPPPQPSSEPGQFVGAPGPAPGNVRRGSARAVGTVANLKQRFESHRRMPTVQIVNFRLERYDARGNRLQPVPIEMRGITITGHVSDGERVQVVGRFNNGILYASSVTNLTTGGGISTRATGGFGRRLGRGGEAVVVLLVLLILVACVRFIPAIYINTPFGLHEYRNEVHGTCDRLSAIAQQSVPIQPDSQGNVDRDQLVAGYDAQAGSIRRAYTLLLAHRTPLFLRDRHKRVEKLMPQLNAFLAQTHKELQKLPAQISILTDLPRISGVLSAKSAPITSQLTDAMTYLAGGSCSVA